MNHTAAVDVVARGRTATAIEIVAIPRRGIAEFLM